MRKNKYGSKLGFLWVVLLCFLVIIPQAEGVEKDPKLLAEVREYVKNNFIYPVTEEVLNGSSVEEVVEGLGDPYSVYFTPEQYQDFLVSTQGNFGGVGLQVELKDGYVTVVAPLENTPAARVGIKRGDRILAVNGENVVGQPLDYVVSLLRGEPGTTVIITVGRPEVKEPLEFILTRENIRLQAVKARMLENSIGYIAITNFTSQADEEFEKALGSLKGQGMKALILDLRDNPGGYLNTGLKVAAHFAQPQEPLLHVVDRTGKKNSYQSLTPALNLPTAVLVNDGSASAAEIVAGAIQDLGAGTLVGTQTFGKASVQTIFRLSNGGALKLTTAKYLTPQGQEIDGVGLTPDYVVEGEEAQLKKALELLKAQLKGSSLKVVLTLGQNQAQVGEKGVALDQAPYLYQGRTMVPLRFVLEAFGGQVRWDKATQRIHLTLEGETIILYPGQKQAVVEGKRVALDVPPQITQGRTFVPLRFVSETLGAQVHYHQATKTVTVVK